MDSSAPDPRVLLLTRAGCHLCAAARETVAAVAGRLGVAWAERRIDGDPELLARHAEEVPVLLVDGTVRDFWVIDARRLEGLLTAPQG
ncbi:thioredoxin family protein [Zafaria cholistanensis]|uniref:Thioredoxin family protein n=1 Tax=Zafaria cholistanensis TaxID=1682741 RepID=A0A5A7NNG3_9MICC|nr:glutaredoxin family protein [Zafaria cholistanensis]GER22464.1 thioredoxin family protein [Zafaria cholistanensis]